MKVINNDARMLTGVSGKYEVMVRMLVAIEELDKVCDIIDDDRLATAMNLISEVIVEAEKTRFSRRRNS